ncbi:MAG: hypothetical protein QM582_05320 [Micropruina sp.]
MRYLDHEPGGWFLLERDGALCLDVRYSYSALTRTAERRRPDLKEDH